MRPAHNTDQITAASAVIEFSCVWIPDACKQSSTALITGRLFNAHCKGK
jgi:uncharacterized protein YuzB (UPF0349 family)